MAMSCPLGKLPRLSNCELEVETCGEAVSEVDVILFEVTLEVHDNGPGIPKEQADNLFTAFATTKVDGLGLGLLSVRSAVQAHDGNVQVGTSPLGGAMFSVRLPRKRGDHGTSQSVDVIRQPAVAKA